MSFILDALKKSENERQQQASAEFAAIPSAPASPRAPRWIWVLIALLVVNVAIVSFAMLRNSEPPAPVAATPEPVAPPRAAAAEGPADEPSFAERISTAEVSRPTPRAEQPPVSQRTSSSAAAAPQVRDPEPAPGPQTPVSATSSLALPTLNELRLNDGVELPDLHLDIHVHGARPADRFVFINMKKHQEGSVLAEGPRVDEITPDGVVLDYRGTRFVLPRE